MSAQTALEWYYSKFQIRGFLAASACQVFGRPKEISVQFPVPSKPNTRPIRTADSCNVQPRFVGAEYAFELPFSRKIIIDACADISMAAIYCYRKYLEAKIFAIKPVASISKAAKKAVFEDTRRWAT